MRNAPTRRILLAATLTILLLRSGPVSAMEAGFSLKDDAGIPTLKDLRLTLPDRWGSVSFFGRNRARYEAWNYFASANDNDYEFGANQLRLGGKWVHEIFNVNYTHQYTQLSNLPATTSAGAGAGSLYFSNSRQRTSRGQFVKYLNIEIKQTRKLLQLLTPGWDWAMLRGVTETFGRFNYSSGNEMKSADAKIDWLKTQRIGDRLLGGFEWSQYGRSFDGVKAARDDNFSNVSIAAFNPTQGGFEERAQRSIQDVDILALEANIKKDKLIPGMEEQFFYYNYDDHRNIASTAVRYDNSGVSIPAGGQSDIELHTFGGHLVGNYNVGDGVWDVLGWGAIQTGDWFELNQSAYAWAAENGYQFTRLPWSPWIRGGYNVGSGDDDAGDGDHGTFYQMLPTARLYSFSILYNMMNTQDAFASLILKPQHNLIVRSEVHVLNLSERADRWYIGSGTMHNNAADDFAARASNNQSSLGKLLDTTVIYNYNPDITLMLYYGHFFGDDVVKRFFTTNRNCDLAYLELTLNF